MLQMWHFHQTALKSMYKLSLKLYYLGLLTPGMLNPCGNKNKKISLDPIPNLTNFQHLNPKDMY